MKRSLTTRRVTHFRAAASGCPIGYGGGESEDQAVHRLLALKHVVQAVHVLADVARSPERRPEEIYPRKVVAFDLGDVAGQRLVEHEQVQARHQLVHRLDVVPVVDDHAPLAVRGHQAEVGIDRAHVRLGRLVPPLQDRSEEVGFEKRVTLLREQGRGMCRGWYRRGRRERSQLIGVKPFTSGLPQVVVVVARDEPDLVGEQRVVAYHEVGELLEHRRRHLVVRQRQLEHVAREHERWGFGTLVCPDQVCEAIGEAGHDRGTPRGVCGRVGGVGESGEDAVLCAEVEVGQDYVSDIGQLSGTSASRSATDLAISRRGLRNSALCSGLPDTPVQ